MDKMEDTHMEEEITKNPKKKDKLQQDFSAKVAEVIPAQTQLAKSGNLAQAIENLLALEKHTRQGEDYSSTSKLAIAIVRLCHDAKDWKLLIANLHVLSKRRGQMRSVIQDFVREAMTYLENIEYDVKMDLISALRTITEGKIFVEIERAKLTRILAQIREKEGKVAEAADILQEIQVETFGQMDKFEKADFILEQTRLCLDKGDFIKAQILSNKLTKKSLGEKDMQDRKLRYYELMVRYFIHDFKYLDIAKCYEAVYDTEKVKADPKLTHEAIKHLVAYLCLARHSNERSDMLARLAADKHLEELPISKQLVTLLQTIEIIRWGPFEQSYAPEFNSIVNFTVRSNQGVLTLWQDLRKRIVEHNVRVIAQYYTSIQVKRLAELLELSVSEAEKFVCDLVSVKEISAKIHRPSGIISFGHRKEPNEVLNEWGANVHSLLNLVENTCHLIQRENMVHKIGV